MSKKQKQVLATAAVLIGGWLLLGRPDFNVAISGYYPYMGKAGGAGPGQGGSGGPGPGAGLGL
jgi:hypothetical protein